MSGDTEAKALLLLADAYASASKADDPDCQRVEKALRLAAWIAEQGGLGTVLLNAYADGHAAGRIKAALSWNGARTRVALPKWARESGQ